MPEHDELDATADLHERLDTEVERLDSLRDEVRALVARIEELERANR